MIQVSVVTRRLKEGKTYEDFRKAWYHTVGFGVPNRMYTMINAFNPREIVVISVSEITPESFLSALRVDVKERIEHPLDDVIDTSFHTGQYGLMVSEDDFSGPGKLEYRPSTVRGEEIDLDEFDRELKGVAEAIKVVWEEREKAMKEKGNSDP